MIVLKDLIGLDEQEARDLVIEADQVVRIIKRDGVAAIATRDYNTERVNLVIEHGKVTGAQIG